jgi:squalene synthase HpnC
MAITNSTDINVEITATLAHYENFPVILRCFPKSLRQAMSGIYYFARIADDIADDPQLSTAAKLQQLQSIEEKLWKMQLHPYLTAAVQHYQLDVSLLQALLEAFKQDAVQTSYADFAAVLAYCEHSAVPIGKLLLQLAGQVSPRNTQQVAAICKGLQLLNFVQDISYDLLTLQRCYVPLDWLASHHLTLPTTAVALQTPAWQQLMQQYLASAYAIFLEGRPLRRHAHGWLAYYTKLVIAQAEGMFRKLQQRQDLLLRPQLGKLERLWLSLCAILPGTK